MRKEIEKNNKSDFEPDDYTGYVHLEKKVKPYSEEWYKIKEKKVKDEIREEFLNTPFTGTIEERLLDEHLYLLTKEDMTLSLEERLKQRIGSNIPPIVKTGKVGVLAFIKAGKDHGATEEEIAKSIWIEMITDGVEVYVNIKDLKIEKNK